METFKTYTEALNFAKTELNWKESEILERKESNLYYLMIDAGSEDVVYFEKY